MNNYFWPQLVYCTMGREWDWEGEPPSRIKSKRGHRVWDVSLPDEAPLFPLARISSLVVRTGASSTTIPSPISFILTITASEYLENKQQLHLLWHPISSTGQISTSSVSMFTCSLRKHCWPRPWTETIVRPDCCRASLVQWWGKPPYFSGQTPFWQTIACWFHNSPWRIQPTGPGGGSGPGTLRRCPLHFSPPPSL